MAMVAASFNLQGISLYLYIDDWLLVSTLPSALMADIHVTLSLLSQLGEVSKSQLIPSQRLLFMGETSTCGFQWFSFQNPALPHFKHSLQFFFAN